MSNKKKKKEEFKIDICSVIRYLISILVSTYCCVLFFSMPLIYHDKYFDIGEFKYKMFMTITVSFLLFAVILLSVYLLALVLSKKITKDSVTEFLKSFSVTDMFVLAFVIASMLSFLLSTGRTAEFPRFFLFNMTSESPVVNLAWEGYKGWNMGLRSQLMFAAIYFLISRFFLKSWKKDLLFVMLATSAIVFVFGVLHRFNIDPLELYKDIAAHYKKEFLSTLGQATWYSSFMVQLIPIGMSLFIFTDRKRRFLRIVLGTYCAIGAATLVTQNSDSAYMASAAIFGVFFAISFADNERFMNFVDLLIIMLSTMKVIGIFQILFPEQTIKLDKLSFFLSKSVATWILLALIIAFRVFISKRMSGNSLDITKYKKVRNIIIAVMIACIPLGVLTGYLNTKGLLPTDAFKKVNYLTFNDKWGSSRGYTWRNTVEFMREDKWRSMALTGAGPDCYSLVAYATEPRATEMLTYWKGRVVTCCHNEWLNMLVNEGILGLISYLGIFVSAFIVFIRKTDNPVLPAGAACIAAYFFHNFFCYQQILCTPMIFSIIALCEWARRDPEVYS